MLKRIALAFLLIGSLVAAGSISLAPTAALAHAEPPDPASFNWIGDRDERGLDLFSGPAQLISAKGVSLTTC
jgi:Spy/CpxP family protein refolding chaperone